MPQAVVDVFSALVEISDQGRTASASVPVLLKI